MPLRSMRARTAMVVTAWAAFALALASSAMIWNAWRSEEKIADQRLASAARGVAEELKGPAGTGSKDVLEEERELEGERIAIYIEDSGGSVVQHSVRVGPAQPPIPGAGWRIVVV